MGTVAFLAYNDRLKYHPRTLIQTVLILVWAVRLLIETKRYI